MSLQMMAGDPALDAERRRALRRMRLLAGSLLVFAAVVFLLTRDRAGFWGFVNAGAEASMVGAIADWFAVVALFKRPLGLPIPHTALIPRRKDDLGRSLEEFVAENFMAEQIIRDRLAVADLARKAGDWLSEEANADRVVREAATLVRLGLARIDDDDIRAMVSDVLVTRFAAEPLSPIVGSLLKEVVADKAHHGLVDLAVDELLEWLKVNEETFSELVMERAPWWSPQAVSHRVSRRLHVEIVAWLEEISGNPFHPARETLDRMLAQLADDLLTDSDVQQRLETLKVRVLSHPQVTVTAISLWQALRRVLDDALADDQGLLRSRLRQELMAFGRQLQTDPALRAGSTGARLRGLRGRPLRQ
ncbi:MAG: DUF445 domain-containing protein [Nocardioidaceae bacterium]